jgi:DNA-binding MarR family transcriptional regulator
MDNTPIANNLNDFIPLQDLSTFRETLSFVETKLYRGNALTSYILMLSIYESHRNKTPLTIKQLCTSNVRSQQSYRQHLDDLINDGWCSIEKGPLDKRQSIVVPTEQLLTFIQELHPVHY